MDREQQMSESMRVAILLAIVGGFFDAYTYTCRGGVFANAQTGNIVQVGMTLAKADMMKTLSFLIPIISFIGGVFMTLYIKQCFLEKKIHWRQMVLVLEMIIVVLVGLMPLTRTMNMIVNILISFICAMQAEAFKKVRGNPFSSTMCTGNLRSGAENLYTYITHKNKLELNRGFQYFIVILFFILGVMLGVYGCHYFNQWAILLMLCPLMLSLVLMDR